ncbi:carboxylesterase/lipase family protein [Streptomyces omiyaensis]|uniref:Carboxylic ester hydrolase n=1 Tax=Streptomyces omiyaensis TaxID=68247 RepID=A0ABW7C1C4_9ACTN
MFRTTCGEVRGFRAADDVVAVLGVPYAAPPFGADRFRAPRPAAPWSGVRDGTRFGPVAPQSAELPGAPVWSPGDEDVLTVNVWTPAPDGGSLPVLVWFHGGAYAFGSSAQPDFDGTALARAGLVVVTLNHRLGFEGFGHLPGTGGEALPDNRGLLDQVAALRWVRENIAGFGGDPGNVTVAGQSSGAAAVACLMVTDRARGLFRRAIAHSPASVFHTRAVAAATTREIAAEAGRPATPEGLASAPPEALVAAADRVVQTYRADPASGSRHYDPSLFAPVLGGDALPVDPLTALAAGAGRDVDLLVCHTTEEYWLLDAVGSCAELNTDAELARFAEDFGLPAELVDGYRAARPHAPVRDVYLAVFGDLLFGEFGNRLADAHAEAGGRTYLSRFDRRRGGGAGGGETGGGSGAEAGSGSRDGGGTAVRAWHCADVPFAFGNHADPRLSFLIGCAPTEADHGLARRMVRAWAGFAATGDPGWAPLGAPDARAVPARTVHVWTPEDQTPDRLPATPPRELWATVGFPVLRP